MYPYHCFTILQYTTSTSITGKQIKGMDHLPDEILHFFAKNSNCRTILHDFESAVCLYGIIYGLTVHIMNLVRTTFGPLPKTICWWNIFLRNFCPNAMQMSLDFNMIFRVRNKYWEVIFKELYILKECEINFLTFLVHLFGSLQQLLSLPRRILVFLHKCFHNHVLFHLFLFVYGSSW